MDTIISYYQQRLDLHGSTFSRIDHDDAMVAIVYKVTQPNGVQLILKICSRPKDFLREVYFLQHFAGKLPVPRIIHLVHPQLDATAAILMECLPGTLLGSFTDELAYQTGSLLARIHLNRVAGFGDLTQPETLSLDPSVNSKFEEGLRECVSHLPSSLIEKCRLYYDTHRNLLTSVDGPCIIHRDFRAGNVIVNNGEIKGIIDWSSGRASFAEEDFVPLEHGEWPSNSPSKKSFLAGYASIRLVPDYTAIMPLLRLNRAIAIIGFTVKRGTLQSSNTRVYQFNRGYLEEFFSNG